MTHRRVVVAIAIATGCGGSPSGTPGDASSDSSESSAGTSVPGSSTGTADDAPTVTGDPTDSGSSSAAVDDTSSDTGPPASAGLEFEPIAIDDPVVRATAMAFLPGSPDFLLMSKDGDIAHYAMRGDSAERLGEIVLPGVYTSSDCGAISMAFDPGFARNRLLFVGYCKSQYASAIVRLELGADFDYDAVVDTMAEVIEVGHPQAANPWHNVGSIGFDPEGNLWAVFGDKTVPSSAQDLGSNLGSIVRIVPDRSPGGSGYTAAADNPFYGDPERSWDIWAYGLRSPWKAVRDAKGRFWIGDVGSDSFEEVNVVTAAAQNFGWPQHEGLCTRGDCGDVVDPITTWPHGPHPYIEDDEDVEPVNARVTWVGAAYDARGGDRYDGLLTDRVLFGDSCLGYVRAIELSDAGEVVFDAHLAHLVAPTSWAQGPDGYLYVVTYGGCGSGSIDNDDPPRVEMWRAVPAAR
jgi:glucose/arabinose dehydrogenase